jgi:hypothetical protein
MANGQAWHTFLLRVGLKYSFHAINCSGIHVAKASYIRQSGLNHEVDSATMKCMKGVKQEIFRNDLTCIFNFEILQ